MIISQELADMTHLNLLKEIYNNSKITIYAIDYSLSPESKFPLALNEAVRSYTALRDLGYQANNIIIGGDSAGGNLSLVCTLKLQENNQELPSKLFLLSPWTDLTASGESIELFYKEQDVWHLIEIFLFYNFDPSWVATDQLVYPNNLTHI